MVIVDYTTSITQSMPNDIIQKLFITIIKYSKQIEWNRKIPVYYYKNNILVFTKKNIKMLKLRISY